MKWWVRAIIVSVVASALLIGTGIFVTEVALKRTITPQQDQAISETVGQAVGVTVVLTWVVAFTRRKRPR
jgi:divalent metal cation (Fe/Co/Zn/Cd) transporter